MKIRAEILFFKLCCVTLMKLLATTIFRNQNISNPFQRSQCSCGILIILGKPLGVVGIFGREWESLLKIFATRITLLMGYGLYGSNMQLRIGIEVGVNLGRDK